MANSVYANARAIALENNLLGSERLSRMIDSSSAEDGLKVLSEVNFGEGVVIDSALDFEKLISAEKAKLFDFIRKVCPVKEFTEFILLPNDFHNAEAFIKCKYLKKDADKMLVEDGLFTAESMRENIMVDEYKDYPDELSKALLTADGEFVSQRATGAGINGMFQKYLFKALERNSQKNKELKQIYKVKADCANIGIALRMRNFADAKEFFVEGGFSTETELKALCEESLDLLKEKCKFFGSGELIELALEGASKKGPLSDFERSANNYALKLLKKEKFSNNGIHPFMLYCYYKLAELENVRIIMVGLINGLDKAEIKGRLREGYEG